ncbi:MAG: exopolysaccharide biosynthesis polyprenyl glycosylphosphotransferase [Alphaproteobacteria bacterium]|nr:exopolysaccharide biosynthesis polyprenyl glycosylphosphotransferase [Alphaproteobacteria bacterium]
MCEPVWESLDSHFLQAALIATHAAEPKLDTLVDRLKDEAVDVRYLLPSAIGSHTVLGFERSGGLPTVVLSDRPLPGWNAVVKRIEDLVLGVIFLLLAAPLLAMIALTIRLTMGAPVLFRQQRHGFNNNTFTVFKFRTMTVSGDDGDVAQAKRRDPRVTGLGAVLRRTSLDELPQLFNVIRGDMSLVGPRPHAVSHNTHYAKIINGYLSRHRVKPGITGWAQVNGLRGETDTVEKMQRRVEFDQYYIDNWSLVFDLRIIAQTFVTLIGARNAY